MKCKFCGDSITVKNTGLFNDIFSDVEEKRIEQFRLKKNEYICINCKKEIMFAQLVPVL